MATIADTDKREKSVMDELREREESGRRLGVDTDGAGRLKGSGGRVLIVAGSRDVPGGAVLAGEAAMRAGAGKLQLAVPDEIAVGADGVAGGLP